METIESLIVERDTLKLAVNIQTDLYRTSLVEIERMKAELDIAKAEIAAQTNWRYMEQERDRWKTNYESMVREMDSVNCPICGSDV